MVCERLFVRGRDGEARLGRYSGTGALAAWIRVVALRVLTDLARGRTTPTLGDAAEIEWLAACEEDPDVSYLKEHYRQGFKTAFHQAVGRLSPQQRNLLRHQLLRGLSIDKIAALYHVHRATAARWLEQARVDLRRFTREEMIEQCGVDRLQFDSVVRLIASRMEISLPRALGEHPSQS